MVTTGGLSILKHDVISPPYATSCDKHIFIAILYHIVPSFSSTPLLYSYLARFFAIRHLGFDLTALSDRILFLDSSFFYAPIKPYYTIVLLS